MSTVTKTAKGWTIESTSTVNGMLEQGGVSELREFYSNATLTRAGVDPESDPKAMWNEGTTVLQYISYMVPCDKVLNKGHKIQ